VKRFSVAPLGLPYVIDKAVPFFAPLCFRCYIIKFIKCHHLTKEKYNLPTALKLLRNCLSNISDELFKSYFLLKPASAITHCNLHVQTKFTFQYKLNVRCNHHFHNYYGLNWEESTMKPGQIVTLCITRTLFWGLRFSQNMDLTTITFYLYRTLLLEVGSWETILLAEFHNRWYESDGIAVHLDVIFYIFLQKLITWRTRERLL
jgi:hypothetical protein